MAISAKKRKSIPKKEFGLPGEKKYPVDTKARAVNAKARAAQQLAAGSITQAEYAEICRKANNKISKSRKAMK